MRKLQTKDNRKANTGITLITLVITIAVLAILAGVSLNAILGDDGILDIAQQRSDETQEKTAQSEMQQLVLEYQLSRSEETLEEFLKEKIPDRIDKVTNNGDNTLTMEKDGYKMVVNNVAGIPKITVGTANVVANGDGTGEALGEASTYLGNTLYITFSHSITGGTTTVEPSIPYAVTANGTYKFTVTGTVNEKSYTKEVSVTVNQFKTAKDYVSSNVEVTYPDGKKVWIPEGFKIADDSASTVQGGVVIEDKDGNQFVWVPVDTIADYKRTAYKGEDITSTFSETLPEDEKNSVTTYKGFYIGRYEAGDKDSTEASTPALRTSSSSTSNKISIKANQVPYNYITRTQAKSLAEGFKTQQKYSETIKTKLVSSYAWDTTIAFLQKVNSDYGSSSEEGNYNDTTFSYTDIKGVSKTKASGSTVLIPTGQTTPVCNIYDMGGNVWEWTTESFSDTDRPCTTRGGDYYNYFATYPAGCRLRSSDYADVYRGFRLTLFM